MKPIQLGVLILCLCSTVRLHAQSTRLSVSGKITDSLSNQNLSFATVLLFKDTTRQAIQADQDGNYTFENLKPGTYSLQVLYLGYREKNVGPFQLAKQSLSIPVPIVPATHTLQGTQVTALKPIIEQTSGKMIIHVSESPLAAGNTLEEILRRSPGVKLDDDGNLTLDNKKVMVYINDRPTYFTASVLRNLFLSTAGNAVDKIELITNPTVKYDAAATAVINIRMKKTGAAGINGSLNLSGGGGRYARYTGGGDLNYRKDRLNIYGNYNYQRNEQYYENITNRKLLPDYIDESNYEVRKKDIHNANAGISYSTAKHTIGLDLKGNFASRNRNAQDQTLFRSAPAADFDSLLSLHTVGNADFNNYAANLFYQHNFDSTGTQLSINGDYYRYDQQWSDHFSTSFLDDEMKMFQLPYVIRNTSPVSVYIRSASADLTRPTRVGVFEAGLKTVFVKTDSDIRWETRQDDETWAVDVGKTNHFIYNENVNAGYLNYHNQFKKWTVQAGLRVENTHVTGNSITLAQAFTKNYTGIYPGASLQYLLSPAHRLGLSVRRSLERPQYEYVNPFLVFRSKYYYFRGNPNLDPQNTTSVDLSYTFRQNFFATLTFARTNDYITGVYESAADKVLIITFKNVQHQDLYNLNLTYSKAVTKYWNMMNAVQLFLIDYNYLNLPLSTSKPGVYAMSSNTFSIPKLFTLEVSGVYSSRSNTGLSNLSSYWTLNAGVQRNILKNRATIKASVNDIFKGQQYTIESIYQQVDIRQRFIVDSRYAMLSFVYHFGNNKIRPRTERQTGIEKEKKRVQAN
jgi:hypothetical protein